MPTPFTHLETAQRLLKDDLIPASQQALLQAELSAFLVGNIAADARIGGDLNRESTHFYAYDKPMDEPPWRVMLARHPALRQAHSPAQQAFLAGYVAHLSMDEIWTTHMLGPHFVRRDWGNQRQRFLMLHALLIYMDERDYRRLLPWQHDRLIAAQPDAWLPFISDALLAEWRDFIGEQIKPGGVSQTLNVFGPRINHTPEELRAILDSPERMQADLWAHVTPAVLAEIEALMYARAREQMGIYLNEFRLT